MSDTKSLAERYGWYFLALCLLMVAWMAGAVAAPAAKQTARGAAYREMVEHLRMETGQ